MDSKISSSFWSDPDIEALPAETKLAVLWLLTNERISLCGYAEVTPERFSFETKSPSEGLGRAYQALPKSFKVLGKGYVARNFIAWQFGRGRMLATSNMSWPIVNAMRLCPAEVVSQLLSDYPELRERYDQACAKALIEPLGSHTQGQRARARVRVREGARAGERAGGEEGGPGETRVRPSKAGSTRPDQHPEPMASRMVAIADVMRRQPDSLWNDAEKKALGAAGLLELSAEDFNDQVQTVRRYYRATIPQAKTHNYWRRTTLPTLLNNWPSELDKARAWARDAGPESDGVRKV